MGWPLASSYSAMLQNPQLAFKDKDLKQCAITRDKHNQPLGLSGAFAVVYQATLKNGDKLAVRPFTSSRDGRDECYRLISDYLGTKKLKPLVGFNYLEKGIRASDGKFYPMVTMDWVPGHTLFDWVGRQCTSSNGNDLRGACDRWAELVDALTDAKIAHGDLQHGNILVTDKGEFKLVDYDCMCVPKLVGRRNLEIGVKPYQHPARNEKTLLSPNLDNFSALFILVALRALSAKPSLWIDFVEKTNYDKLLIRDDDLENPGASTLYKQLQSSPDKEVGRLSKDLVDLYRADIDSVPFLKSVLFSYDKVRSLISQKMFDDAVALVSQRSASNGVPPDLVAAISNARERVECLQALRNAVELGDEAGMKRHFQPKLLNDYPAAKEYLETARHADKVLQLHGQLRTTQQRKEWRKFVGIWDANRNVLEGRKSSSPFVQEVDLWRKRNAACDAVLKLANQPAPDPNELSQAWNLLTQLGGHPETDSRRQQIELTIRRNTAWHALKLVPWGATHENDAALDGCWKEDLFAGWDKGEAERARVTAARGRLTTVRALAKLGSRPVELRAEKGIVELASKLPDDYDPQLAPRIKTAYQRLQAFDSAKQAFTEPMLETDLVAAAQRLELVGAMALLHSQATARVDLAKRRAPLINTLKQIPTSLPVDQLDLRLLTCWRPELLNDCHEAKPWKTAYETAALRKDLLDKLKQAVEAKDELKIAALIDEPCLRGYPFERVGRGLTKTIEATIERLRRGQRLIASLEAGDAEEFFQYFDYQLLKQSRAQFDAYQDALAELVTRQILPREKLGLAPKPFGASSLVKQAGSGYRASWKWPQQRFTDQCMLAVCARQPKMGDDPRKMNIPYRVPILRLQYEKASGRVIHVQPEWNGFYVAVWAMIDVGFNVYASEPIVLGRLSVGEAAKDKKERGKWWS